MKVLIRSSGPLWRKSQVSTMLLTIFQITMSTWPLRFKDLCPRHAAARQDFLDKTHYQTVSNPNPWVSPYMERVNLDEISFCLWSTVGIPGHWRAVFWKEMFLMKLIWFWYLSLDAFLSNLICPIARGMGGRSSFVLVNRQDEKQQHGRQKKMVFKKNSHSNLSPIL